MAISLKIFLAGLRLGLKNPQVGEKWVSDDGSYFMQRSLLLKRLLGGKFDLGMYGKTALGGAGIGIGKVSADFAWQTGSVSDIKGTGGEMNVHYGNIGGSITTGNNGNIDGFGFSLGTGYNASSATTMNGNCSIRNWGCGN